MNKFKIENFCEEHNLEFKKYYNYLNNPYYVFILLQCIQYVNNDIIQTKLLNMIKENHSLVLEKINKIDIIINFYKKNNLINKSDIGKFFVFYEIHKKKTNLKNNNDLLKLFNLLINYDKVVSVLKECFYIFSDYRACLYFMTPNINSKNIKEIVTHFRDNLNTLNQIISKIYVGDKTPWGSLYYTTAYSMLETLLILKKYFKDPLKILNIKFHINKKCDKNKLMKKLTKKYHEKKFDNSNNDDFKIESVSQFILNLKRLGYDLWFTIPLIFDTIYENYELSGYPEAITDGHTRIYHQKMNNKIGILCFILITDGFITNINIFNNFND